MHPKDADGMVNSVGPDQTSPLGSVRLGLHFLLRSIFPRRGAVVKWLECLGYGAESPWKGMESRLGFTMRRLENCQPSSKLVFFFN